MEWCNTHHIRAQYIENTLQCTEMKYSICSDAKKTSTRGSFWLHQTFYSSFEDNELYVLSFGVPAKPGIAKDRIEAGDICRKPVADFIDSLLAENLSFTTP